MPANPSAPLAAPLAAQLDALREAMLDALLRVMIAIGALLVAGNVLRAVDTGWQPLYAAYGVLYAALIVVHLLRARLPFWLRQAFAVGVLLVGGAAGFLQFGLLGNTLPVFLGAIFVAAALYGMGQGAALAAVCVLVLAVETVALQLGLVGHGFDPRAYLHRGTSWIAAAATFLAMGTVILLQSSRLLEWLADWILAEREAHRVLDEQVRTHERVEADLRRSEQTVAGAFRAGPHWITLHRLSDGAFIEANPAFERLTGYAREAVLERDPATLPLWDDARAWPRLLAQCEEAGTVRDAPLELRASDGRVHELSVSATRTELDGTPAMIAVARDVSERNRARRGRDALRAELERRIAERTDALQAAKAELEGFVDSALKDLRAPLASIDAEERALRESLYARLPPDSREMIDRVARATAQTRAMLDSLVALARINQRPLAPAPLDLTRMAGEIVDVLAQADPARRVEVSIQPGLAAEGDAVLVHAALEQLIANAWKFGAAARAPRIEVGSEAGAGATEFFVRDNGAGFDAAYAAKLFQPFERLHPPTEYPGLGIGLAIAAAAVRRHGGRIRAVGSVGGGATIRFTLARDPDHAERRA